MSDNIKKLIAENKWRGIADAPKEDGAVFMVNIPHDKLNDSATGIECDLVKRLGANTLEGTQWLHDASGEEAPTHFRALPDDRLANVCQTLLEGLEKIKQGVDDRLHYTLTKEEMAQLAKQALAKAEQQAGEG